MKWFVGVIIALWLVLLILSLPAELRAEEATLKLLCPAEVAYGQAIDVALLATNALEPRAPLETDARAWFIYILGAETITLGPVIAPMVITYPARTIKAAELRLKCPPGYAVDIATSRLDGNPWIIGAVVNIDGVLIVPVGWLLAEQESVTWTATLRANTPAAPSRQP